MQQKDHRKAGTIFGEAHAGHPEAQRLRQLTQPV